jgi:predicted alpha/beta hydrolase
MTVMADEAFASRPLVHEFDLRAEDGVALAARHFAPSSPRLGRAATPARGAVLIAPALGVPQTYYEAFAHWLASTGFHALTFDYRGIGASRRGPLRDVDADLFTWAKVDLAAALEALEARAAGVPVTWLGHSLGGQVVPFVPGAERVSKIVTVATGSGYWRDNSEPLRRRVWMLWFGAVPIATPLFGYFPGQKLGMVGDLPRGVVMQWRKWCLHRDYVVGAEHEARARFAAVRTPIVSFSFTDDEMMSARSIASIHDFYVGAPRTMHRLSPHDLGLSRVGHFGAFRRSMRAPLWERWLRPVLSVAS